MKLNSITSKGWKPPLENKPAGSSAPKGSHPDFLYPEDQIEFLKKSLPIIKKLIPTESQAPMGKPSLFKQDLNIPLMSTGADVLQQLGLTGKNIGVAVLDSGVAGVADLEESLIGSYRLKDGKVIMATPNDPLGHGTAVAGFIAGSGKSSGGVFRGMAPDAKIISVQVANEHGGARYSDLPRAIHWLVENKDNFKDKQGNAVPLRLINISMGFPEYLPTRIDPLTRAVREAWEAGIAVVAAAGNDGPEPMSLVGAPADEPSIIVVGATDNKGSIDRAKATVAEFSSRGPTPEGAMLPTYVAPGTNVVSVNVPGSFFDKTARASDTLREMKDDDLYTLLQQDADLRKGLQISEEDMAFSRPEEIHKEVNDHLPAIHLINDYYIALSGTSFAGPIGSGGTAQILQWMVEHHRNPTPDALKALEVASAEKFPSVPENAQGAGYVNFKKAYDALQNNP